MNVPRATPLSITAYAVACGLGCTTANVRRALLDGRSGLSACPLDVPFSTVCGAVTEPLPALPSKLARWESRTARLAAVGLTEVEPAIAKALRRYGAERVGLFLGTSTGGIAETESMYSSYRETGMVRDTYDYRKQHEFFAFTDVVRELSGIRGPRSVVSTACSSGAKVFASARRLIDAGVIDAALVGGVDSLCHTTVRGFHSLGVMDANPCRPFSLDRAGMNVGEGVAYLLLEKTADARVSFLGIGETSDAHDMASPAPDGRGARDAMAHALLEGGVAPADVDYVNAHGTATKRNDSAESAAIHALLGGSVPVSSTKAYTGHTLAAAGAIEAVFSVMAIEEGVVPSNRTTTAIDPDVRIHVASARVDKKIRYVLSNSLAFGGSNVSLLFGAVP